MVVTEYENGETIFPKWGNGLSLFFGLIRKSRASVQAVSAYRVAGGETMAIPQRKDGPEREYVRTMSTPLGKIHVYRIKREYTEEDKLQFYRLIASLLMSRSHD